MLEILVSLYQIYLCEIDRKWVVLGSKTKVIEQYIHVKILSGTKFGV